MNIRLAHKGYCENSLPAMLHYALYIYIYIYIGGEYPVHQTFNQKSQARIPGIGIRKPVALYFSTSYATLCSFLYIYTHIHYYMPTYKHSIFFTHPLIRLPTTRLLYFNQSQFKIFIQDQNWACRKRSLSSERLCLNFKQVGLLYRFFISNPFIWVYSYTGICIQIIAFIPTGHANL